MPNAVLERPTASPLRPAVRRPFRNVSWLLLALAGLVAAALSPWGQEQIELVAQSGSTLQSAEAARDPSAKADFVVCLGYVDSESGVIPLIPMRSGRVEEIRVKENEEVKAGALLLRLDAESAELGVREARAALAVAETQLAKATEGHDRHAIKIAHQEAAVEAAGFKITAARHNLKARRNDLEIKSIGKKHLDPVLLEETATIQEQIKELLAQEKVEKEKLKDLRRQDLALETDLARAEVHRMEAKLSQARQILGEHFLKAPADGKVLRLLASPGELLGVGEKRIALQFCPKGLLIIRAEVDQAYAHKVRVGYPVKIEDDMHSEMQWKGKVKSLSTWYTQKRLIAQEKFQLKDTRTLECIVAPENDSCPLLIGQRVRITVKPPTP